MFGRKTKPNNLGVNRTAATKIFLVFAFFALAFAGLFSGPATTKAGAITKLINFQGKLTTSAGLNVADGTYSMRFKIWDSLGSGSPPTGGTLLWTETWDGVTNSSTQVTVTNGVFSVQLGTYVSLDAVDFTTKSAYLTVDFNPGAGYDGEMAPRKQLVASAFAYNANNTVGDGRIDIAYAPGNTTNPGAKINYSPSVSSSNAAESLTAGANVTGPALNVIQSGTGGSILIGATGLNGSTQTYLGANPGSFSGNFVDFQIANTSEFKITSAGNVTTPGTIQGLTITNNGTNTLNITAGKALNVSNTITLAAGADSQTFTFPAASATIAGLSTTQSFTGQNTFSRNGAGTSDHTFGLTGTPINDASSSLLRIGNLLNANGNAATNGGTYLSINEPSSGAGFAADFFNFENSGASVAKLTSAGALTVASCSGCGGAGSPTLDSILAATADGTAKNSGAHPIIWNWDSLTTQTGLTFGSGATGLTTGGILAVGQAGGTPTKYVHSTAETGNLANLNLTDASTLTSGTSITNEVNLNTTINATSGAGARQINALNIASPTLTACSAGSCLWTGLNITTPATATGVTSHGITVTAGGVPAADMVNLTNANQSTTADGINAIQTTWWGAPTGTNTTAAQRIDLFNKNAGSGGTVGGLRIVTSGPGGSIASNTKGIIIDALTSASSVGVENAIDVGSGWDNGIAISTSAAETGLNITAGATPTTDLAVISNASQAASSAGINDLNLIWWGAPSGTNINSAERIDAFNKNVGSGGTANGIHIVVTGAGGSIASGTNGLSVDNLVSASSTATENGVLVGQNWNNAFMVLSSASFTQTQNQNGLDMDYVTNFTPLVGAASNLTGATLALPGVTESTAAINHTYTGYTIASPGAVANSNTGAFAFTGFSVTSPGALVQSGAAGTINWNGAALSLPAITQTTGAVTANGLQVTIPASAAITTAGTMNGIQIVAPTTSGPTAGTLTGINIANLTSPGSNLAQFGMYIGSGWNSSIAIPASTAATPQQFSISNNASTPVQLLQVRDLTGNSNAFGSLAIAGAFLSKQSYFGEEFNQFKGGTAGCTDTGAGGTINSILRRGDEGSPGTACTANSGDISTSSISSAASGTCIYNSQNGANGFERIAATGAAGSKSDACMESIGTATAATNDNIFNTGNLPQILMKVRPSVTANSGNPVYVGISNFAASKFSMVNTDKAIYFSNCSQPITPVCTGTSWVGYVQDGTTNPPNSVTCPGTISTSQFSLLRIEMRKSTAATGVEVQFFVVNDVTGGPVEQSCGTITTTGAAMGNTAMSMMLKAASNSTTATNLDVDFFRVWQDDNIGVDPAPITPTALTADQPTAFDAKATLAKFMVAQDPDVVQNAAIAETDVERLVASSQIVTPSITAGGLTIDKISSLNDAINFENNVNFIGTPFFNSDTAGFALVKSGQRSVDVKFSAPYENEPIVTATVNLGKSSGSGGGYAGSSILSNGLQYIIANRDENGFTILLNQPAPADITFSWIALQVQNASTSQSDGNAPVSSNPQVSTASSTVSASDSSPTPTPSPTVAPSVAPSDTPTPTDVTPTVDSSQSSAEPTPAPSDTGSAPVSP